MQVYLVGGAVRDKLLGIDVQDKDWVVVGARAEDLLQQGFQAVGKDFPVFLHPHTHEEYALARTERKTAKGYTGFTFHADEHVTLEQDLLRRDLTINAMAQDADGNIIDPFGGQADLQQGILRHVSPAFPEDPVRILRTARFAARYNFIVAEETMQLMQNMVLAGEADALVAERVWQELAKGLMEKQPSKMVEILYQSGCLARILPEVAVLFGVPQTEKHHPEIDTGIHTLLTLQRAADLNLSLAERYAALLHDLGKALTPKNKLPKHHGHDIAGVPAVETVNCRLRPPKNCADLARLVCRWHIIIHTGFELRANTVLEVFHHTDAFRRPERFQQILNVCLADVQGRLHHEHAPYPQKKLWEQMLTACQNIPQAQIVAEHKNQPQAIKLAIEKARLNAIKHIKQHIQRDAL